MTKFGRLLATTMLALAPTGLLAEELIFNAFLPPHDELRKVAIEDFAAAIERESGSSVTVTIPETTLAPSDRQYEMVRDGIADMAIVSSGVVRQMVALNQISDLPLMSPTARAASVALWETYQKYFADKAELKGVKVLSLSVLPGRQVLSVDGRQIETVEDFEGVKLWSPPGRLTGIAKTLGAVPVNSEFTDLYEYVTKGTVDAVIMTPGSAQGARFLDKVTSITRIPGGIGSLSFIVFISQERWEALDADQQAAVLRAAEGLPARSGAAADAEENALDDDVGDIPAHVVSGVELAGMEQLFSASLEEWKAAAARKGIADPDEVVAFYRSVLARETGGETSQ
ncbi:TRAP transporter substrate-binding protein DctP [Mangrovicoccus sp. HB161399]|uniref:TRAP transporter substrate-binding protein DctP n=1 Tax=Mangrovicoccus sp. HB161399 TaxID=2720392 RepID=UPI0015520A1B|nr:TRAP transporter substrate-binding protein DctP [Mangrovicoccus sp. HB161399]